MCGVWAGFGGVAEIVIEQTAPGEGYVLRLGQGTASALTAALAKLHAGERRSLVTGISVPWADDSSALDLTLRRRQARIDLLARGRVVLRAYDADHRGGRIGHRVEGAGLKWDEVRLQETPRILFTENFTTESGYASSWETHGGTWQTSGVEGYPTRPHSSANPFAYRCQTAGPATATTGFWFWDDYQYRAALKLRGGGTVGLCWYVQDPENCYQFRWSSEGEHPQQLVRLVDGRETLLAAADMPCEDDQWYAVSVRLSGSRMDLSVDGRPLFSVRDRAWAQGSVGLYADHTQGAFFDNIRVTGAQWDVDDFAQDEVGRWTPTAGKWAHLGMAPLKALGPEMAERRGYLEKTGAEGLLLGPVSRHSDSIFAADVHVLKPTPVGLVFGYRAPTDYYLFRWALEGRPQARRLIRVRDGQQEVLAAAEGGYRRRHSYRMAVQTVGPYLGVLIDGKPALDAVDGPFQGGRTGLYAGSGGMVWFDDCESKPLDDPLKRPAITQQFTREQTMRDWAGPDSDWQKPDYGEGITFWHKSPFFASPILGFRVSQLRKRAGKVQAAICAEREAMDSGYVLGLEAGGSGSPLQAVLRRDGVEVAAGDCEVPAEAEECEVRFQQRGDLVWACLDKQLLLSFRDPQPLHGTKVGLRSQGLNVWPRHALAACQNLFDYTFFDAPTDLRRERGVWRTTVRWPCAPQWSFFGGTHDRAPTLWTKREFYGDQVAEMYAALKMDLPRPPGYSNPSNINLTICGNGHDVMSGYTVVFAGWRNTTTKLFRDGEQIAEKRSFRFINPTNLNNAFHRHWFHVQIAKIGAEITVHIDGREAFHYTDLSPLDGGRVGFWTLDNGLMIASARIAYQRGGEVTPVAELPVTPTPIPDEISPEAKATPDNDFETGLGQWRPYRQSRAVLALDRDDPRQGRQALCLVNGESGGEFAVQAVGTPFSLSERPWVRFWYRLEPDVKVNLYVRVRGIWRVIVLTGDAEAGRRAVTLGRVENVVADGQWHQAEFNVLAALQGTSTSSADLRVDEVVLAHWSRDPYAYVGLGGNRWGATYWIDGFRWEK